MLRFSERSFGLGTFGMMVRCSVFHVLGQYPVSLITFYIFMTGPANAFGNLWIRCGNGSPSTKESVFLYSLKSFELLPAWILADHHGFSEYPEVPGASDLEIFSKYPRTWSPTSLSSDPEKRSWTFQGGVGAADDSLLVSVKNALLLGPPPRSLSTLASRSSSSKSCSSRSVSHHFGHLPFFF